MKQFTSAHDVPDVPQLVQECLAIKANPHLYSQTGKQKALGLLFFNPSLRTRMSAQRAAQLLGMDVVVMNVGSDSWKLELEDGTVMDGGAAEHIKDAVKVMSQYCDVLGVRAFAQLQNREEDYAERVINAFVAHATVPVVSLESATRHPLQSIADLMTIAEFGIARPKVAVTWAPHPKALPQAVTNSFLEWVAYTNAEVVLAHPEGYALDPAFVGKAKVVHSQEEAFEGAHFVYAKSWSSYSHYGTLPPVQESWMVTEEKMKLTQQGKFMHCLPLRRNVVATDAVVDQSIVYQQAQNRMWSAMAVLKQIVEAL